MADDDLTPPLADAVRALGSQRGPCPAPAALVEYQSLPAAERARDEIHDHVQVCSRCQLVLMNLDEPVARPMSRWLLPLAAALALVALTPAIYRALKPAPAVVDTVRGNTLQPIAPVGDIAALGAFEWQSPIRAAKYRVTVYRGSQSVWTTESVETRVPRPPALAIDPGLEYTWQADALDAEGSVRMSTPRTPFTVRR